MTFELHETFKESSNQDEKEPEKEPAKEEKEKEKELDAEGHRQEGNTAFKAGNYDEAIKHYNEAIALDSCHAPLFSNRAACWALKGEHKKALADAEKCISIDPEFTKAYTRKGHALFHLDKLDAAEQAYLDGLKADETSEACKRGLADCRELQEKRKRRSIKSKFLRITGRMKGSFEAALAYVKSIAERPEMRSRFLMGLAFVCIVLCVGGFLWYRSQLQRGIGTKQKKGPARIERRFRKLDGTSVVSFLEAGSSSELKLLLLHRTSLSAEAEFGRILPQFLAQTGLPGGLKILAPDRPCHGYSPCSEAGETAETASLFARILSERPVPRKFAYVASGRDAARHALEIVQRRRQEAYLILFRPHMNTTDSGDVISSPAAIAESLRWEMLKRENSTNARKPEPLKVALPKKCAVMLLYVKGDVEDLALKRTLEASGAGVTVEIRHLESLEDGFVSIASCMFGGRCSSEAEAEPTATESEEPSERGAEDEWWSAPSPWWSKFSKDKIMLSVAAWYDRVRSRVHTMFETSDEEEW